MAENDEVVEEFANLSLLVLTWVLEHQDAPVQQGEADKADPAVYEAARALAGHLLGRAERRGVQVPSAAVVQEKFASMVGFGARTAEGGEYRLEVTRRMNCVVGVANPKPGVCLIKDRAPDSDTDQFA